MAEPDEKTGRIPIWRYQITLTTGPSAGATNEPLTPTHLAVDAVGYEDDDGWTVFGDVNGAILRRRSNTILEIRRSDEPVTHQETDQL